MSDIFEKLKGSMNIAPPFRFDHVHWLDHDDEGEEPRPFELTVTCGGCGRESTLHEQDEVTKDHPRVFLAGAKGEIILTCPHCFNRERYQINTLPGLQEFKEKMKMAYFEESIERPRTKEENKRLDQVAEELRNILARVAPQYLPKKS